MRPVPLALAVCLTVLGAGAAAADLAWTTTGLAPTPTDQPTNVLHVAGEQLLWNGAAIGETALRTYLDITVHMSPQPLLVLTHREGASAARLRQVRALAGSWAKCRPDRCLEVTRPAG